MRWPALLVISLLGCQPAAEPSIDADTDGSSDGGTFLPGDDAGDGSADATADDTTEAVGCDPDSVAPPYATLDDLVGVEIAGDLSLYHATADDLAKLTCLRKVEGNLIIRETELVSLEGLENLESVSGLLELRFNHALTDIDGLAGLQHVGTLHLWNNDVLADASGITQLQTASAISIQVNPELSAISLPQIEVLDYVSLYKGSLQSLDFTSLGSVGSMSIKGLPIADLDGFPALEEVQGGLTLGELPELATTSGLASLRAIAEHLQLLELPALTDVDLPELESVQRIYATDNPLLASISMPRLEQIADLTLVRQPSLATFPDLTGAKGLVDLKLYDIPGLTTLDWLRVEPAAQSIVIALAPELADIDALEGLSDVGVHLKLESLPALPSLEALTDLEHVAGTLALRSLPGLDDLSGLGSLQVVGDHTNYPGGVFLQDLDSLTDLSGLALSASLGCDVTIDGNDSLTSLAGLDTVEQIGALEITDNAMLSELAGLEGLVEITGGLTIAGNVVLADIDAIWPVPTGLLETVGDPQLTIAYNPALSQCTVDAFVDALIAAGWLALTDVGGNGRC